MWGIFSLLSKTDALLLFLFLPQTDRISRYDGIHISRNLPKNSPHLFPPTIGMNEGYLVCLYWLSFSMRRRRRSCEIEKWFLVFAFLFQESLEGWWDDKYHQSFWWKSHHHWENGSSWWYAGNLQWKSFLLNYAFWICRSRWRRR